MAPIPRPLVKMPWCWMGAAIRTLDAPRWRVWLAKRLGRRFTGEDMGHTLVGYEWRGKFYFTDYIPPRS